MSKLDFFQLGERRYPRQLEKFEVARTDGRMPSRVTSTQSSASGPSILPLFAQKKLQIISNLQVPAEAYTDLSPKGSVDDRIVDLIDRVNKLEGIVTTSSCAGRISVFLEGGKPDNSKQNDLPMRSKIIGTQTMEHEDEVEDNSSMKQAAVPGGKGKGGRWLFVSHDPVDVPVQQNPDDTSLSTRFGLSQIKDRESQPCVNSRFVKFQFEPMVSHVHNTARCRKPTF